MMNKLILLVLILGISACTVNQGFPRSVSGQLKPINTKEITFNE